MAEGQKKVVPTKEQLEHYAKEAGLVPINTVKDFLFAGYEDATPATNDLGTLVLTHDVQVEKSVEARIAARTTEKADESSVNDDVGMPIKSVVWPIRSAVCITAARVFRYVLAGAINMQVGRKALQDCFNHWPEKDKREFQDNELRGFADRFKSVAEAIHQELVAMANRVG